jgi:hypothetical protein
MAGRSKREPTGAEVLKSVWTEGRWRDRRAAAKGGLEGDDIETLIVVA